MIAAISSFFITIGFGYLFKIPKNRLFWAGLNGMAGGFVYRYALYQNNSEAFSLFLASIVISLIAEIFARCLKTPVTVFLACALIPLVPGGGLYNTMLEIVRHNFDLAIITFINTIISACAIVIGCTLISSFIYTFIGINRHFKHYLKNKI